MDPTNAAFNWTLLKKYDPKDQTNPYYFERWDPVSFNFDFMSLMFYLPTNPGDPFYLEEKNPFNPKFNYHLINGYNPKDIKNPYYISFMDPGSPSFNPAMIPNYDPSDINSPYYLKELDINYDPVKDPNSPNFDYHNITDYDPTNKNTGYYLKELDPTNPEFNVNRITNYDPTNQESPYYTALRDPGSTNFDTSILGVYDPQNSSGVYYNIRRDPSKWEFDPNLIPGYHPMLSAYDYSNPKPGVDIKTMIYWIDFRDPENNNFDPSKINGYYPLNKNNIYYYASMDPRSNDFDYKKIKAYNPCDENSYYYVDEINKCKYAYANPSLIDFNYTLIRNYDPKDSNGPWYFIGRDPQGRAFEWSLLYNYDPKDVNGIYYYYKLDPANNEFDGSMIVNYDPSDKNSPYYVDARDPNVIQTLNPASNKFDYKSIPDYDPKDTKGQYYYIPRDPQLVEFNHLLILDYNPTDIFSVYYYAPRDPSNQAFNWKIISGYDPKDRNTVYYYEYLDPTSLNFNSNLIQNYDPSDTNSPYYLESLDPNTGLNLDVTSTSFSYDQIIGYDPKDKGNKYYYIRRDPSIYEFDYNLIPGYDPKNTLSIYYWKDRDPASDTFNPSIIQNYNPSDTNSPYYYNLKDPNFKFNGDVASPDFTYQLIQGYDPKDVKGAYYYPPRDPSRLEFDYILIPGYDPKDENSVYYWLGRNPNYIYTFEWKSIFLYDPKDINSPYYYLEYDPTMPYFNCNIDPNFDPTDAKGIFYFAMRDPFNFKYDPNFDCNGPTPGIGFTPLEKAASIEQQEKVISSVSNSIVSNSYDQNNYLRYDTIYTFQEVIDQGSVYFYGNLDETKLWNKALNKEEVFATFDAVENPNNTNLIGYWKFNEGGGQYFYDISRYNTTFHENHGKLISDSNNKYGLFEHNTPTADQLGNKSVTDENGNYVIAGINFSSGGSYFKVVPSLGIHRFDPTNKLLYISQESTVFNNIDFTDMSSFPINGRIVYKDTKYPVEGVMLKVDGVVAVTKDKKPVMTDVNGEYTMNVPIGLHYISAEKNGHTFTSSYWPGLDANKNPIEFDFQDRVDNINFVDNTLIHLIGKVVGGPVEGSKPTGSKVNPSKNNIGSVSITLKSEKGLDLWNNKATVTTTTNKETGFYEFYLIPEKFILNSDLAIRNDYYTFNRDEDKTSIDLSNKYVDKYVIDSIFNDSVNAVNEVVHYFVRTDTVLTYNESRDWIWRSSPNIRIENDKAKSYIGDSTLVYAKDSVPLQIIAPDRSYILGYPAFTQLKQYNLKIKATESYVNHDNPSRFVTDLVPINDGEIVVDNALAMGVKKETLKLSENGESILSFKGGNPNESAPYTMFLNLKLKINNNFISGAGINQECYLMGVRPTGTVNFVTGPDKIDFILHDPPGSNSYSYLNKGFTVSKTTTSSDANGLNGDASFDFLLGAEVVTNAGSPVFSLQTKIESDNSLGYTSSHDVNWTESDSFEEKSTYNFNYSSSESSNYVGPMADVFIGHGTNMFYGQSVNVKLMEITQNEYNLGISNHEIVFSKDSRYFRIGARKSLYVGQSIKTDFMYTKNHIEKYLIPNLVLLRNSLFLKAAYTSVLDPTDANYGKDNTDKIFKGASIVTNGLIETGPSYRFERTDSTQTDSVFVYNSMIKNWINNLQLNEKSILTAKPYESVGQTLTNLSFDAGSKFETSVSYENLTTNTSSYEFMISAGAALKAGIAVNGLGFKMSVNESYHHNGSSSSTDASGNSSTVGFVLEDNNQGDYFSLDVKKDPVYGSPVFITRGGQSSCPYEDEYRTKYFEPGTQINAATMHVEMPKIQIKDPIVSNIPETSKAEFSAVLSNNSEVDLQIWYGVFVDPASNPDGAIVRIDGKPLTDDIMVLIPAGKSITKTITLEKGKAGVNSYENIGVIIHSQCQFDASTDWPVIADTAMISAYFNPVCTNVNIEEPLNQWIANTDNEKVLPVKIGGYDLNLSTFKDFMLQYKPSELSSWVTLAIYINDNNYHTLAGSDTILINNASFVKYNWDLSSLQNRAYDLRVISHCSDGSVNVSSVISGIYDDKRPQVFGKPQPADGILNVDDEILLNFDEDIQSGLLSKSNISLTGIQNNTDLRSFDYIQHNVSLHFDGISQNMFVDQDINLKYSPFTIEFWAKRDRTGRECLVAHGDPSAGGTWIGFDDQDHFMVTLNGQTLKSDSIYNRTGIYNHYAAIFDNSQRLNHMLSIVVASGDNTEVKSKSVDVDYFENGKLEVGYSNSDQSAFKGNMHDLRIWNKKLTDADISARRYTLLNGHETGLIGCWQMNDGNGLYARDIAFAREGLVNATWTLSNKGYSLNTSGGYAVFNSSLMELSNESDFTLEFWFKSGIPGSDQCILSNGRGDGTDASPDKWSVTATLNGKLKVQNDGTVMEFDGNKYLNNNWHHFAMSVKRKGTLDIYLDGVNMLNKTASLISGMGSPKIVLGARYSLSGITETFDQKFSGVIDEVRIWEGARSQSMILSNINNSLRGTEMGLKAYFPFEDIHVSDPSVATQTLNNQTEDSMSVAGNCVLSGNVQFSNDAAPIKLARPVVQIPYTFLVNGNKLLITPEIEASRIENTKLEISVSGVYDKHGNRLKSPAVWSAFMNQNQLVWEKKQINITCSPDNIPDFELKVMNTGGNAQNWQLENLPVWLSADLHEGTLEPLESQIVKFTVNPAINIGQYRSDLYLSGTLDFKERCSVDLTIKEKEPAWTVIPANFETSMSLIGKLSIAGIPSTDENDLVAAFIDGECRGVQRVKFINNIGLYLVNLTIYGSLSETSDIHLRVWDASKGNLYTNISTYNSDQSKFNLTFLSNSIKGTPSTPVMIKTTDSIGIQVPVHVGWNWLSFNLESNQLKSTDKLLGSVKSNSNDLIKSTQLFDQFVSGMGWDGTLTNEGYHPEEMYKLKTSYSDSIELSGVPVLTVDKPITLTNGWNWIGYTPQYKMSIQSAFSYLSPMHDDLIKSQTKFAMYDHDLGWIGSLEYMQPNAGYMYKSNKTDTIRFVYPQQSLMNKVRSLRDSEDLNTQTTPADNESNMTILARVVQNKFSKDLDKMNLQIVSDNRIINEVGPVLAGDAYLYPVTIKEQSELGKIEFILVQTGSNLTSKAHENVIYKNDKVIGSVNDPFKLNFTDFNEGVLMLPNPFTDKLTIKNIPLDVTRIALTDLQGRIVKEWSTFETDQIIWNVSANEIILPDGIYMLHLSGEKLYKPEMLIKGSK